MAQKYSFNRGKHWDVQFWLVFDAWGGLRLTRGEPDLKQGERAMFMSAAIPHSLFRVPQLRGKIAVADQPTGPIEIDTQAAQEAFKAALGVDIDLRVIQPEEAE